MKIQLSNLTLRVEHKGASYRFECRKNVYHHMFVWKAWIRSNTGAFEHTSFNDFRALLTEQELATFNKIMQDLRQVQEFIKEKSE